MIVGLRRLAPGYPGSVKRARDAHASLTDPGLSTVRLQLKRESRLPRKPRGAYSKRPF